MKIMEQEDIVLIQKILNGNKTSEQILYDKYYKIIKNYLKNKYSNCSDVDDNVSEILIKVFLNLRSFDYKKSKFKSWVLTITNRFIIDKWRNKNNLLNNSNINLSIRPFELTYVENHSIDQNEFENNHSLNYISKQISISDFTMLDMKYVQGYDYNEIGVEFNVTSSTVSNRINYIKTKLKKNNIEYF